MLVVAAAGCRSGDARIATELRELVSGRRKVLVHVYEDRDFRPLWIGHGRPSGDARKLAATLCEADREGLRLADYDLAGLQRTLERVYRSGAKPTPAELAKLDLELSMRFLDYGADLLAGRLDPAAVDDGWYIRARRSSVDSTLRATLKEGGGLDAMLDRLRPRQKEYAQLVDALADYRGILEQGGWPAVAAGPRLTKGSQGPRVVALRIRLRLSHDLDAGGKPKPEYDDRLAAAVARFQERHGLPVDSAVGPATLAALNVPVETRIRQIEINLERYRWLPPAFGDRYVLVNIPEYRLVAFDGGKQRLAMRVIVGDEYGNATPVFADSMRYLVFRPHWYVPSRILAEELIPAAEEDEDYFAKRGLQVVDRKGAVLDPKSIDWSDVDTAKLDFRVRQVAGADNALGRVKFMFPNRFSIYLHDTPAHELFDQAKRTLSHGCVRVEQPVALADYVLDGQQGWDEGKIKAAMELPDSADAAPEEAGGRDNAEGRTVRLEHPVPVYLVYLTAYVANGVLNFRDDPYGKDRPVLARLGKPRARDRATCEALSKLLE